MTLLDLNQKELPEEGQKDHWSVFRAYKGTPVHLALLEQIEEAIAHLGEDSIFSAQLGKQVLAGFDLDSITGTERLHGDDLGTLFGMVLWNHLALRSDTWILSGRFEDIRGNQNNMTYFRQR